MFPPAEAAGTPIAIALPEVAPSALVEGDAAAVAGVGDAGGAVGAAVAVGGVAAGAAAAVGVTGLDGSAVETTVTAGGEAPPGGEDGAVSVLSGGMLSGMLGCSAARAEAIMTRRIE